MDKKQARRSLEALELDHVLSDDECIMENGRNRNGGLRVHNLDLNAPDPNENENLDQAQVGEHEKDVFAMPP